MDLGRLGRFVGLFRGGGLASFSYMDLGSLVMLTNTVMYFVV